MRHAFGLGLIVLLAAVVGCSDARGARGAQGSSALVGATDPEEPALVAAVRAHPRDAATWGRLGGLWNRTGRYDAAAGALTRAVRLAPNDAEARLQLAVALYNLGRDDEAREELAGVTPQGADAHWLAAHLALRAGDRATAARECATAVELDRARYEAPAFLLATRLARQGD